MRILSAVMLALGLLFAAAPTLQAQPVTIRLWLHEHPPRIAIDREIIAAFEKANPDVKVQYDVIPVGEYPTKLLTAFAAGSGPELFNTSSTLVTQYVAARILAPVDYAAMGYADQAALEAKYPSGLEGIRFQGRLYGVPTEVSNWACFANNAIWKEAGLDPAKDWPKTWEELPALAEKLTQRDQNGVPRRRGFDFNWTIPGAFWFLPNTMMHQLGHDMVDEAAYKAQLDSPAGQRVFQFFQDWVRKHRLGGPQYTDSRTEFLAGRLGAECSFGIWGIPQMQAAKIDWTVLPAPRFAGGADLGIDAYAFYMMVNARSAAPAQKAAWRFARFYTDQAAKLFAGAGLFVPRAEVTQSEAYRTNPAAPFFLSELGKAKFSPRVVGYAQVLDTVIRGRDRLVQGEPIGTVLPETNNEVNAVMNRERNRAATLVKQ